MNFLPIFLKFCIMDGVGTERNDNFYFLSFSFFSTLFRLQKKRQWYFIIFWIVFTIFLEFSITLRVRTKQNDTFYFLSFSALSNLFWLEMTPYWFYNNFLTFFYFFEIFYHVSGRNGTIILIFSLSLTFPTYVGLKRNIMIFLNFLNFFAIFFEFCTTDVVGTEWNKNFYFLSFLTFSTLFCLQRKP